MAEREVVAVPVAHRLGQAGTAQVAEGPDVSDHV